MTFFSGKANPKKEMSVSSSGSASLSKSEMRAFTKFINGVLGESDSSSTSPFLSAKLPISEGETFLLDALYDGIIFCKLINYCVSEVIDETLFDFELADEKSKTFRILENLTLCLDGARRIGCNVINLGPNDIYKKKPGLVYGLLWQVIKHGSLAHVNLGKHPELHQIGGEDLASLPAEDLLLRWFNYHLEKSGDVTERRASNFGSSIKDSILYGHLLNRLEPGSIDMESLAATEDLEARAEAVLNVASKLMGGISFANARDITEGNERVNLVLMANLFKKNTGMFSFTEQIDLLKSQLSKAQTEISEKNESIEALNLLTTTLESDLQDQKKSSKALSQKLFAVSAEKAELEERLESIQDHQEKANDSIEFQMSLVSNKFELLSTELEREKGCRKEAESELEKAKTRMAQIDLLIEHLMQERMKSEEHVQRLKKFYNTFNNAEALAKFCFKSIECDAIESDPAVSWKGQISRKGRTKDVFKLRYVVVLENFMFVYKSESKGRKDDPTAIYRLDDCIMASKDINDLAIPEKSRAAIVGIEQVISLDGQINFGFKGGDTVFFAGCGEDAVEFEKFQSAIDYASSWWVKRGKLLLNGAQKAPHSRTNSRTSSFSLETRRQSFTTKT